MEEHESQADSAPPRQMSGRGTAPLRSRAQQLLSAQRARLEQIDADLTSQCEAVLRTAAEGMAADAQSIQRDFVQRDQALTEKVRQHQLSLDQFRQQQEALAREHGEIEATRVDLAQSQQAVRRARAELEHDTEQLARSRGRSQQLEERLAREAEQLEVRREQTKNQRRRIAQELKAERASQHHEVEELRQTIENLRITQQRGVEQATAEIKQKREELEQRRQQHQQEIQGRSEALEKRTAAIDADAAALEGKAAALDDQSTELEAAQERLQADRRELDRHEQELAGRRSIEVEGCAGQVRELSAALAEAREAAATSTAAASELRQTVEELRQSHERLRASTEVSEQRHGELQHKHELLQKQYQELRRDRNASQPADSPPPAEWQAEREALIARAAAAEQVLSQVDPQRLEESQKRFEMAIADVRDLKRRNAELEEQLIGLRAAGVASARQPRDEDVGSNWELTKRRMLEALEADDCGDDSPEEIEQRLTVESTIQITDEIVARKDLEIAELQALLSHQSSNIGAVAVGAAAIAENFDRDELIQQEREKLSKLQEEWRNKLRQAEIDISIERARIARQRVEIEDKVSAFDSARAQHDDSAANPGNPPKHPSRGRWLARLGLKDDSG